MLGGLKLLVSRHQYPRQQGLHVCVFGEARNRLLKYLLGLGQLALLLELSRLREHRSGFGLRQSTIRNKDECD